MNLSSHLIQRALKLPPPLTRDVVVERDLRVPMPDGVDLLADRWAPRTGAEGLPTALIRCPYGRRGAVALGAVRPLAERGYRTLAHTSTFQGGGVGHPGSNGPEGRRSMAGSPCPTT
ncbi:hypothetical protein [Streptomyces adelaidensis]|uniref:hypothetical protein n=1 Tax=Streptomyces adelaidensis TaxID=2796465 RepID=UPI001905DC5E|nr:hypothetical protein [Streptomyces adelaidensis]